MTAMDTYRHAIEWELSMDFKLIRCRQSPAGIQQDIVELEVQAEVCGPNGFLLPPGSSQGRRRGLASGWQRGSGTVEDKLACPTHQEEHSLLKPLPGELAEAAQADELLQSRQSLSLLRGRESGWRLDSGLSPHPARDSTALTVK